MPAPLTLESYQPCVNEEFVLHDASSGPQTLTLRAADAGIDTEDQVSFSLLFEAADGVYRPQQIYRLSHARLGEFDLFLVPIRRKRDVLYEAVFNLLKDGVQ